ncbi:MAG TPA: alpha/beta fold hydrolase [Tepidisphaeraceae bacterium]|jgi:triacylglycerol lipase|nr:alpha/beta fold hydrolase [Tepidisphaeraceae bacterium]
MLPIVLHHGVFGLANVQIGKLRFPYFRGGIEAAIAARGHPLITPRVHPTAGIATRARELKAIILRQLKILGREDEPVIVLAHSMGGLDARYMIHRLGMASRVRALVTIATPHRGSAYADWCLKHLGQRLGGLSLARFLRLDVQSMSDLTTAACGRFNEEVPDSPLVRYYSVSGARPWNKIPPFALHSWKVIHDAEGDNDCLVSVRSSIWGKHLGIWPVDHLREINKRLAIDFDGVTDITPYYLDVLDVLKEDGISA